ncbi:MAG: acetyltransferase [Burkholderiales bacterium PBB6]|nr:MAG: acetyltransferase [Burkholderiales bacterium PBB6]
MKIPSLTTIWRLIFSQLILRWRLGSLGRRSIIYKPLMISGSRRIHLGDHTSIREFARLETLDRPDLGFAGTIRIGNRVNIEQGVHIVAHCDIQIDDQVSVAPYCVILDVAHPADDPVAIKIGAMLTNHPTKVHIGAGTLLGAHCTILPNVTIGKGCIIGANSVVNRDIPEYSIAAGAPARVISSFDLEARKWIREPKTNSKNHSGNSA